MNYMCGVYHVRDWGGGRRGGGGGSDCDACRAGRSRLMSCDAKLRSLLRVYCLDCTLHTSGLLPGLYTSHFRFTARTVHFTLPVYCLDCTLHTSGLLPGLYTSHFRFTAWTVHFTSCSLETQRVRLYMTVPASLCLSLNVCLCICLRASVLRTRARVCVCVCVCVCASGRAHAWTSVSAKHKL